MQGRPPTIRASLARSPGGWIVADSGAGLTNTAQNPNREEMGRRKGIAPGIFLCLPKSDLLSPARRALASRRVRGEERVLVLRRLPFLLLPSSPCLIEGGSGIGLASFPPLFFSHCGHIKFVAFYPSPPFRSSPDLDRKR